MQTLPERASELRSLIRSSQFVLVDTPMYICVNTYKTMLTIVARIRNTKVQYFPLSCKNKNRRGLGGVFQIRKLYCNRKKVKINCNKQLFCINLVGVQL